MNKSPSNFKPVKFYINKKIDKKTLESLITQILTQYGTIYAINTVDSIKTLGFRYATTGGISIGIEDLRIPKEKKEFLDEAKKEIFNINLDWKNSLVTDIERFQKIIDTWNNASESLKNKIVDFFKKSDPLNSIYMIAFSGARGNISQVRQLVGMRGLMADQKGQIIDLPIITNFREGLGCSDYIISSYGARKGIVDTALRTADSGYLTRRLVEVAQDILIRDIDCFCSQGIRLDLNFHKNFRETLKGRTLAHTLKFEKNIIIEKNKVLDEKQLDKIEKLKIKKLYLRSPLTCKAYRAICQYCYGWNLAYRNLVNLGDTVGVIAAQSIGEPGTQMTMRTFHTGGIFTSEIKQQVKSQISGLIYPLSRIKAISTRSSHGNPVLKLENQVTFRIIDWKNKTQVIPLLEGSLLYFQPGTFIKSNQIIAETPALTSSTKFPKRDFKSIISTCEGEVSFGYLNIKESARKDRTLIYNERAGLVWILSGFLKSYPNETKIILNNFNLTAEKSLGKIKLITSTSGFVNLNVDTNEILLSKNLIKTNFLLHFFYKNVSGVNFLKSLVLTNRKDSYNLSIDYNSNFTKFELRKNQKYFIKVNKRKISKTNWLLFHNLKFLEFFPETDREIYNKNGLLFIIPNKPSVFSISIKNESKDQIKTSGVNFPGEKLFGSIEINHLSLYKIISFSSKRSILLIFPIYQIQIPKILVFDDLFKVEKKTTLKNTARFSLSSYHGKNISLEKLNKIVFYQKFIYIYPKNAYSKFLISFNKASKNFSIVEKKHIKLNNLFNGRVLGEQDIKINLLIKNEQYVDAQTILGFLEYKINKNEKVHLIKRTKSDRQHFLFVCDSDLIKLYNENELNNQSSLIQKNTKLNKNLVLKNSLFYFKKKNNQLFLRKATPFFLTKGAILRYQEEDFVEKGENFAILVNYKKQTEDIVQGLPKIEELIELRGNSQNAILCEKPGMIYRIESSNKDYELEVIEKEQTTIYFIESLENLLIKKYDFLTLGEPITTGTIDPHELLRIFCNFYYKKDGIIKGLYKALYKLQQILVNSIQAIYKSQGIDISDKHLEIIVRQMSSKIEIRDPGDSPMLPGENLEVYLIEDLCNILSKNSYRIPSFQPILAGVTRSSLKSESFLSSSSFQETRKMLAEAAIEGKVDWLRSLKGNVITGKPIPAGTGFNHFKEYYNHPDLFDLVKFFKYRENQETQKIKSTIDETIQTNIKKKTKNF